MGAALWVAAGIVAFLIARTVPLRRTRRFMPELLLSVGAAAAFGVIATVLDFGGWNDADWRAITFSFLGSATAIGILRALRR